jgi:hypothetical protein
MNPNDPLAQLKDIHLPDPVGWWPLAPGWWVLMAIVLTLFTAIVVWAIKRQRQRRYLQQACAELQALARSKLTAGEFIAAVNAILKRVALQRHCDTQSVQPVGTLSGHSWLSYLDQTLAKNSTAFRQGAGRALGESAYRPNPDVEQQAVLALAKRWVKQHRKALNVQAQGGQDV